MRVPKQLKKQNNSAQKYLVEQYKLYSSKLAKEDKVTAKEISGTIRNYTDKQAMKRAIQDKSWTTSGARQSHS